MLKLYNTLTKKIEEIKKKDHINLYTCGPTAYNYAHIGNLRSYILADLLYRALKYNGFKVKWVMNITDIEDKIIKSTIAEYGPKASVADLKKLTDKYFQAFLRDLKEVNVLVDEIAFYKVTDIVPQIQDFIIKLMNKGYAYKAEDGSTYFSIEEYQKDFGDYGALVGEKFLQGKKIGARVKVDEYEKDNLSDFALWKAWDESDAQIYWDHPKLGKGRPGWHIECSVINHIAFGGEPTDIHTGGVDLIFPHHSNEIAQSQALLGKGNFVRHWFHSEHLLVDGKKMAKSLGNFYTLNDLQDKVPVAGLALRYLFLQSSYRVQQNFVIESYISAYRALEKLFNLIKSHKIIGKNQKLQEDILSNYINRLKNADSDNLGNDLNLPAAVAQLWEALGKESITINTQDEIALESDKIFNLKLNDPPSIFEDIEIPDKVQALLNDRQLLREKKDFAKSDELRKQIEDLGFEVLDTPEGQKVKKKLKI